MQLYTWLRIHKMEQQEFAKIIGCSPQAISNYITGKRMPTLKIMQAIARETKNTVTIKDMVDNYEEKNAIE